ncbi:hypothetical protein X975_01761, partial [Stegodyphus mimosarum]
MLTIALYGHPGNRRLKRGVSETQPSLASLRKICNPVFAELSKTIAI